MIGVDELNLLQAQNEALVKQNQELQKENRRLKKEYDILDGIIDIDNAIKGKLKQENAELKAIIDSYQPRLQRYKDILQEIKAICKMDCGNCPYNQDCDCNFQECGEAKIDDILDIINKAEEG